MVTVVPFDTTGFKPKEIRLLKYITNYLIKGVKPDTIKESLFLHIDNNEHRLSIKNLVDMKLKISVTEVNEFLEKHFETITTLVEPDPRYKEDTIGVETIEVQKDSIHIHHMVITKLALCIETLVMICRYSYYVNLVKLFSDEVYDWLEAQAVLMLPKYSPVHLPGSSRPEDYWSLTKDLSTKAEKDRTYIEFLLNKIRETDFIFTGLYPKE